MSTRDELARRDEEDWPSDYEAEPGIARNAFRRAQDALIAEGWRKMPAAEELESALAVGLYKHILNDGICSRELHRLQVREILALMDGGSA